jgi:hypothetical protein
MANSGEIIMFVEVWVRIKEIIVIAQSTLLTDSNLILTLAQAPPRSAKEFEKFVGAIGMRPTTFRQTRKLQGEPEEKVVSISFPLDVYSQPIKLDYDVRMFQNILTVADTITSEFNKRLFLQDSTGTPLRNLDTQTPVIITGGSTIKEPFPGTPGNPASPNDMRYHFSANINVSYLWTCPARST